MPIPQHGESDEPQADAGLLEYIDRRRLYQVRQRRHRILVATTVTLALVAAILAVSNVILLNRLGTRATVSPPPAVATAPPAAPIVAPAPAAPPSEPAVSQPAAAVPAPAAVTTNPVETPSPPVSPASAAVKRPVPEAEDDSARRTARWLVQTHGRLEAENRAAKVAEFYSGQQGAFWHRVLLNVRQEPEP